MLSLGFDKSSPKPPKLETVSVITANPASLRCDEFLTATSEIQAQMRVRWEIHSAPTSGDPEYVVDVVDQAIRFTFDRHLTGERVGNLVVMTDLHTDFRRAMAIRHTDTPSSSSLFAGVLQDLLKPRTAWVPSEDYIRLALYGGYNDVAFFPLEDSQAMGIVRNGFGNLLLSIPNDLDAALAHMISASSGFTSDVSDNLSRMMYFSVSVITTLGFGDIVPVTGLARLLVATEAISGIVVAGLFLSSLTKQA